MVKAVAFPIWRQKTHIGERGSHFRKDPDVTASDDSLFSDNLAHMNASHQASSRKGGGGSVVRD